jgi:hypothetical protein
VDSEGVLFDGPFDRAATLPVLSGVVVDRWAPGARMPEQLRPFFGSLGAVAAEEPALLAAISEIRVERKEAGDELVLFPYDYHTPVRMGPVLNVETLKAIILVLDVVRLEGLEPGAKELDFRSRTIVYRSKGG